MPTVELDIRQLADEGGTEPFAPITVTDAVLDEDGNTLTDTLDEINAGLTFKTLVTDAVANTAISLPSEYTELQIIVRNSVTVASTVICKNEVDFRQSVSNTELFINNVLMQGYADAWGISADVLVQNNTLKLASAKQCVGSGGVNDVTSTARMTVFYR